MESELRVSEDPMIAVVEETFGGDPVYSERPELSFDNLYKDEPFSLWRDGLVQTYLSYGASAAYGRATVIGNPLLGGITVWRQSGRDDGNIIVQHHAHRLTVDKLESLFTYWLTEDDGRPVAQIARTEMEAIVDSVRPEPVEKCSGCGLPLTELSHGWGECS